MSDTAIDVLIPAFNVGKTIHSAVASIQAQTVPNIRIIVVDDGSTDDTAAVLAEIAALDTRLFIITQPNNGIVDALNAGLAYCTAPLIARHDGDDLAAPDRFEKQMTYLSAHPDCVAVSSPARQMDEDGIDLGTITEISDLAKVDASWIPAREPYLLHPFLMARRDAMERVGGYRYVHHSEDADLFFRLEEIGRLHILPEPLGSYRIHTASVSSSVVNGRISALHSQLATISARRRRSGQPDLVFSKDSIRVYQQAGSLEAMLAIAAQHLTPAELRWLSSALAAKLMELAGYRPYELDLDDSRFMRAAYRQLPQVSAENSREIKRRWAGTISRLFFSGYRKEARALMGLPVLKDVASRLAFRAAFSPTLRAKFRQLLGRGSYYK